MRNAVNLQVTTSQLRVVPKFTAMGRKRASGSRESAAKVALGRSCSRYVPNQWSASNTFMKAVPVHSQRSTAEVLAWMASIPALRSLVIS